MTSPKSGKSAITNNGSRITLDEFAAHLQRLRAGDADAVELFVVNYEQYIRRSIRFKLARSALKSVADSVDVCQSVLGSFLLRLSAGEYELQNENDLKRLLSAIASKKFAMLRRFESAAKRNRNVTQHLSVSHDIEDKLAESPHSIASYKELNSKILSLLTDHEKLLLHLRSEGQTWDQIADQLQLDAVVLRKRLSRAVNRISAELGLMTDPEHDER